MELTNDKQIIEMLNRWAEEKPQKEKNRILFYCPSYTHIFCEPLHSRAVAWTARVFEVQSDDG
jgi:hypothetical protein